MAARLITADDLCVAAAEILAEHLPAVVAAMGWDEDSVAPLAPVTTWEQVPTLEALTAAEMPAGAVTSPGLAETPTRRERGRHDAVWRISVGVYDRGDDYHETARRVRRWAAAVRATLLEHRTLNGVADGVWWRGEEYRQKPNAGAARTLGGCAVAFDVKAANVIDLGSPVSPGAGPLVQSVHARISTRPATQE